jgi:hypothetical protein
MTLREEEGAREMVNILSAQLDCASYSVVVRNYKTRKITFVHRRNSIVGHLKIIIIIIINSLFIEMF